jgi:hypothetical protein
MRIFVALALVLAAAPAHAMGVYRHLDVIAWSSDGASALLARDTTSSGQVGQSRDFLVVSAKDAAGEGVEVTFTNTLDGDTAIEHVDPLACVDAAQTLTRALAAKKFKGVAINASACATAARDVVMIGDDAARVAASSWIAAPAHAHLSKREAAARAATKLVLGDASDFPASVAATSGRLYLVVWGINGDDSTGARASAVRPTKAGLALVGG